MKIARASYKPAVRSRKHTTACTRKSRKADIDGYSTGVVTRRRRPYSGGASASGRTSATPPLADLEAEVLRCEDEKKAWEKLEVDVIPSDISRRAGGACGYYRRNEMCSMRRTFPRAHKSALFSNVRTARPPEGESACSDSSTTKLVTLSSFG